MKNKRRTESVLIWRSNRRTDSVSYSFSLRKWWGLHYPLPVLSCGPSFLFLYKNRPTGSKNIRKRMTVVSPHESSPALIMPPQILFFLLILCGHRRCILQDPQRKRKKKKDLMRRHNLLWAGQDSMDDCKERAPQRKIALSNRPSFPLSDRV